jgi:hypothetical protein
LFAGASMAAAWLLVAGLLATSAGAYVWLTVVASIVAWVCAVVLVQRGDRGAAAGVALATGLGLAIAAIVVIQRWTTSGWPLW